jgi:hypothetical protein
MAHNPYSYDTKQTHPGEVTRYSVAFGKWDMYSGDEDGPVICRIRSHYYIYCNMTIPQTCDEESKCSFSGKNEETRAPDPYPIPATGLADQACEEICQFVAWQCYPLKTSIADTILVSFFCHVPKYH